jgi:hypothetical protein
MKGFSSESAELLPLLHIREASKSKSKLLYDGWSVSQYVLVSSTLVGLATCPKFAGPGSRIYIPQEQGAQLYPRALGSFTLASYYSQGYDGGILTLPYLEGQVLVCTSISFRNRIVRAKVKVKIQRQKSKSRYDRRPFNLCLCLSLQSVSHRKHITSPLGRPTG